MCMCCLSQTIIINGGFNFGNIQCIIEHVHSNRPIFILIISAHIVNALVDVKM